MSSEHKDIKHVTYPNAIKYEKLQKG